MNGTCYQLEFKKWELFFLAAVFLSAAMASGWCQHWQAIDWPLTSNSHYLWAYGVAWRSWSLGRFVCIIPQEKSFMFHSGNATFFILVSAVNIFF